MKCCVNIPKSYEIYKCEHQSTQKALNVRTKPQGTLFVYQLFAKFCKKKKKKQSIYTVRYKYQTVKTSRVP